TGRVDPEGLDLDLAARGLPARAAVGGRRLRHELAGDTHARARRAGVAPAPARLLAPGARGFGQLGALVRIEQAGLAAAGILLEGFHGGHRVVARDAVDDAAVV